MRVATGRLRRIALAIGVSLVCSAPAHAAALHQGTVPDVPGWMMQCTNGQRLIYSGGPGEANQAVVTDHARLVPQSPFGGIPCRNDIDHDLPGGPHPKPALLGSRIYVTDAGTSQIHSAPPCATRPLLAQSAHCPGTFWDFVIDLRDGDDRVVVATMRYVPYVFCGSGADVVVGRARVAPDCETHIP